MVTAVKGWLPKYRCVDFSTHKTHTHITKGSHSLSTQAQFQQSVTYFQRFFELARGLSDNAMLEAARFNLGVARGAVLMEVGTLF